MALPTCCSASPSARTMPRVLESLHRAEAHIASEEMLLEARSLLLVH